MSVYSSQNNCKLLTAYCKSYSEINFFLNHHLQYRLVINHTFDKNSISNIQDLKIKIVLDKADGF